jgi:hypothetical protein
MATRIHRSEVLIQQVAVLMFGPAEVFNGIFPNMNLCGRHNFAACLTTLTTFDDLYFTNIHH